MNVMETKYSKFIFHSNEQYIEFTETRETINGTKIFTFAIERKRLLEFVQNLLEQERFQQNKH